MANELLRWEKRRLRVTAWLSGEAIPKAGDFSIITDWEGKPYAIIQTKQGMLLPFKAMTFDIYKREDENLDAWQNNHICFFTEEGKQCGYTFSWEMEVVYRK